MLRLAKEREELAVINDQFGAPTGAELLADCTAHAIRMALNKPEVAGLYHLVASRTQPGTIMLRWFLKRHKSRYSPCTQQAQRSTNVKLFLHQLVVHITLVLIREKFQQNFALVLPDWQVGVKRMLNELFTTTAI